MQIRKNKTLEPFDYDLWLEGPAARADEEAQKRQKYYDDMWEWAKDAYAEEVEEAYQDYLLDLMD